MRINRLLIVEPHPIEVGFYWACLGCKANSRLVYRTLSGAWGAAAHHRCP